VDITFYKIASYKEARHKIQSGDVVFFKTSSIIGSIIRFLTHSRFSHVGIAFWMETGRARRLMIVEAQGGARRRIVNMSYYSGSKEMDVIVPQVEWDVVNSRALARLGRVPYGWLEVVYVGFREFLLKYFGIKIKRIDFPGEICSEFVANVYSMPTRNISPQLLFEEMMNAGCEYRVKIGTQD
jgi:cell wall-associated NlpC family hydrolase